MTTLSVQDSNPLSKWKWKNRILIIQKNKPLYENLLKHQVDLKDRDMIVILMNSSDIKSYPYKIDVSSKKIRGYYKINPNISETLLIGKDGGVKLKEATPGIERIFNLIDGMPMRQQEMKKKRN